MASPQMERLLRQVTLRRQLARFGQWYVASFWALAGLYAVLLVTSRLLGLLPDCFAPATVALVPVLAAIAALAFWRRLPASQVARLIDLKAGAHDLFLTAVLVGGSDASTAYQPVVLEQAEQRAGSIPAQSVVPFVWQRNAGLVMSVLLLLAVGARYLPQLDPFGKAQHRLEATKQKELLDASAKVTQLRLADVEKDRNAKSEPVEQAITDLEKTFNEAKPAAKEANLKRLSQNQAELGQLWRQFSEDQLKKTLSESAVKQSFGTADMQKMAQWKEELKKGDASGLKKELEDLREQAKKLAAMPDSAAKEQAREQLRQRLSNLADAAAKELQSQALNSALARALEQVEMSRNSALSQDALKAAQDSLELTEQELSTLAQSLKDLQNLEEALKAAQLAKQLNEKDKLDGDASSACKSLADYEELYKNLLAQERGAGPGMHGPGKGEGGDAPHDDSLKSSFKSEKSTSALNGGKLLLEWKSNGVSDPGVANQNYADAVKQVKQGVSEAILQEQVPPAYHDAIKKYFDTLEKR